MNRAKPIPVRLDEETIERLKKVTELMHLKNRSDVIKICINAFLDYFEKNGEAVLPLDWKEILRNKDGRNWRYKKLAMAAEPHTEYGKIIEKKEDKGK